MGWSYNSTRVYVQEYESASKQIIARLQPLSAGTILQMFGYEDKIIKIQGKIVGAANVDAINNLIDDGAAYTLSDGASLNADLYLAAFTYKQDQAVYQTIDPAQDCETPVYTVTLELYK